MEGNPGRTVPVQPLLEALRGALVVSCQPVPGGAFDSPAAVAMFARAAVSGGARGLRIKGSTTCAPCARRSTCRSSGW